MSADDRLFGVTLQVITQPFGEPENPDWFRGHPLWPDALKRGYAPPHNQEGWAEFDLNRGNTPWISEAEAFAMSDISDILYVGRSRGHWILSPYYGLLRWRWRNRAQAPPLRSL